MPSRPLTDSEVALILRHTKGTRNRCLVILGLRTGFRISELLSLRPQDLFEGTKAVDYVTVERRHMKGKRQSRTIPLHREAKVALELYLQEHGPQDFVFPITRMTAHRVIRQACQKAGIQGKVSSHSLRKTFGMKVYKSTGKDMVAVQKALGHQNLSSTSHYLSVTQDIVDKAILE